MPIPPTWGLERFALTDRREFFSRVQNPLTRVRERDLLLRLAQEALETFASDAEVQIAALCVIAYRGIPAEEWPGRRACLEQATSWHAPLDGLLARLTGATQVRWSASAHMAMAYAFLALGSYREAAACFARVAALTPRAPEYPRVDVNLLRARFALGYLAFVEKREADAADHWRAALDSSKTLVPLKDFGDYRQIEQSRAAMQVTMACSVGLSHLRKQLDPAGKHPFDVSYLQLMPSAVHPFLQPLDTYRPATSVSP